jgi:hypothetical protein
MKKQALTGLGFWLLFCLYFRARLSSHEWAGLMLMLAALVWLPLAVPLLFHEKSSFNLTKELLRYGMLPAAVLLSVSFLFFQGNTAALLAVPWFIITLIVTAKGIETIDNQILANPGRMATSAACLFLPIGGAWALADRFGYQPLGFDPAIVLLTSVHFHYAGFFFPMLIGKAQERFPHFVLKIACYLSVIAVPLTAGGITVSQLWKNFIPEAIAGASVAIAGWCAAIGYAKILINNRLPPFAKLAWSACTLALLFSMTLALFYALRPWLPLDWLNLPWMRAWHGTANAILVTGGGLLGWVFFEKKGGR